MNTKIDENILNDLYDENIIVADCKIIDEDKLKVENRNINMDILRVFALLCVISVHFFLYTGFYSLKCNTLYSFFAVMVRTFFMICVPLFIMLSGFLMNKKVLCKKYYKGIVKEPLIN